MSRKSRKRIVKNALFVVRTGFLLSVLLRDIELSRQAVDLSVEVCALGRRPREGVA